MNHHTPARSNSAKGQPLRHLVGALMCLLTLTACGGGGSTASNGVGVGGTGSAAGPVSGFGSIIVNDVRFEDNTARILDDDNNSMSRSDVKLGMLVDVLSGAFTDDASTGLRNATATQITYGSSIKGVVTAKSASSITVLGQVINVTSTTVFDDFASGLTSVSTSSPNNLVEVHALLDASTGEFTATRIERKTSLTECKVSGIVSSLNQANRTFSVGGWPITGGVSASDVAQLANGKRVKVRLTYSAPNCGNTATRIQSSDISLNEGASAEVEGFVSNFVSAANFKVNGVLVNATTLPGGVGDGIRVEADGVVRNGVLVASKVEVKSGGSANEYRLFGTPTSHSSAARTFVVKGVTVHYDDPQDFDSGVTSATFDNPSASLEVRGALDSTGAVVEASEIKLKN